MYHYSVAINVASYVHADHQESNYPSTALN